MSAAWKRWIVLASIIFAAAPAIAQEKKTIIVDGSLWMSSTSEQRRAFLVGVGNMIATEMAYAEKNGRERQTASALIKDAVSALTLPEIETRITRWYESNPGQLTMPVMGVVWRQMVKQGQ